MPIVDLSRLPEMMNHAYYRYLTDYRRFEVFKGGAGAGKSVFVSEKLVYNMIIARGYNVLVVRKVGRDNHDSTFQEIKKTINRWGLQDLFRVTGGRGTEEITCLVTGNKCIFKGLDDVEKIKSVTFETGDLVCVWIEEASQVLEADFNQLNLRLRGMGTIPKHIILSFNPIDIDCWIKARFFDNPIRPEDGFICETTYHDNRFIEEAYKQALEAYKNIDYYYYKVYVLNQWGSISTARVFHNIMVHDFELEEHHMENVNHGLDFGFNHANAYIGCGMKDGELYIHKEIYRKGTLNREFIELVYKMHEPSYSIVGDSASPDKIKEFNEAGLTVFPAEKGPGSLKEGVDWLKQLPCIHIHQTNCPNAAREFPRFKYKELKDGSIVDEYVEIDDDTIAATRYATEHLVKNHAGGHFVLKRRR